MYPQKTKDCIFLKKLYCNKGGKRVGNKTFIENIKKKKKELRFLKKS